MMIANRIATTEDVIKDACNRAGILKYTVHQTVEFAQGQGIKGKPSNVYMLVIQYNGNNVQQLIDLLTKFTAITNNPNSTIVPVNGVVIAPGVYTLTITSTTNDQASNRRMHTRPHFAPPAPSNRKQSVTTSNQPRLRKFDGVRLVAKLSDGEVQKWIQSNGEQFWVHDDEQFVDFEWDTSDGDNAEWAYIRVYARSVAHNRTTVYLLFFDENYHPLEMKVSSDQDDCRECMAISSAEQRLWSDPTYA